MELLEKKDLIDKTNINEIINNGNKLNKKILEILTQRAFQNTIASRKKYKYTSKGLHKPENRNNKVSKNFILKTEDISQDIIRKEESISKQMYNETDKTIILINSIFPNDKNFMDIITENNTNNIFIYYFESIESIQYKNKTKKMIKRLQNSKLFISEHKNEMKKIFSTISNYTNKNQIQIIYNRLLQIKYLNNNLYKQYLLHPKTKEKTLTKN